MWLLTLRDLQYRRSRIALTSLGTGLVLTMILVITGISSGFGSAATRTVDSLNPGLWLLPEGVTGPFTAASAFPVAELGDLDADLTAVPTAITRSVALDEDAVSQDVVLVGLPAGTVVSGVPVSDRLIVSVEAGFESGSEIAVGGRLANVGESVTDLTLFAGTPLIIAPLPFVQAAVFEGADVATAALLDQRPFPAPRGFAVMNGVAVVEDSLRVLQDANTTINVLKLLLWVVAAMLVGTMIYVSARERREEFALLKIVGARRRGLMAGVVVEALIIAVAATVIGVTLEVVLNGAFPVAAEATASDYLTVLVVMVLVASCASLTGLRPAISVQAIDALDDR